MNKVLLVAPLLGMTVVSALAADIAAIPLAKTPPVLMAPMAATGGVTTIFFPFCRLTLFSHWAESNPRELSMVDMPVITGSSVASSRVSNWISVARI